jgi:hypothetical protein
MIFNALPIIGAADHTHKCRQQDLVQRQRHHPGHPMIGCCPHLILEIRPSSKPPKMAPVESMPVNVTCHVRNLRSKRASHKAPSVSQWAKPDPLFGLLPCDLDDAARSRNRHGQEISSALRAFIARQISCPDRCSTSFRPASRLARKVEALYG